MTSSASGELSFMSRSSISKSAVDDKLPTKHILKPSEKKNENWTKQSEILLLQQYISVENSG